MLPIAPIHPRVAALALRSDGKESEHIGFALSRLAHVAQASQFWISPGSRAQADSVPATMLGNARAPSTCASGPSQKRPDLASPPSQSDTSPSGYAPGRQSAPLHPVRSPPCRFDLSARSQSTRRPRYRAASAQETKRRQTATQLQPARRLPPLEKQRSSPATERHGTFRHGRPAPRSSRPAQKQFASFGGWHGRLLNPARHSSRYI